MDFGACNIGGGHLVLGNRHMGNGVVKLNNIEKRLRELGEELPRAPAPVACYASYIVSETLVYISGQLPLDANGKLMAIGKLGKQLNIEAGRAAARLCAINLLSQLQAAVGNDWNRVEKPLKLGGFVNSTPEFTNQPVVINGASEFLIEVMGERGMHARTAVGVNSLPLGAAVEIDAIFQLS